MGDAVKAALTEGHKANKPECEVNIKLIAHPVFALNCQCRDKDLGMSGLDEAMEIIEKAIKGRGGSFTIKSKPTFFQNQEPGEEPKSGSDTDSSSEEEDQDDTMGDLKADFSDLMKKEVDADDDDDEKN